MTIRIELGERSYDVTVEKGVAQRASGLLNIDRKVFLVTDDGVPEEYYAALAEQCKEAVIFRLPQGEGSKNMKNLEVMLSEMMEAGFTRSDCVAAVGGGMVGDIAGFAAATYMRGIDFYNIPTTLLSQADSSIGGKTAVNMGRTKNIAGSFWQPKAVLIDTATLSTLPDEQISSGMAEIIKSGMIADSVLFEMFEKHDDSSLEDLLVRSLLVKKHVVEEDEREGGLRKILNFGHTIGHGIESVTGMLHGHAVALGMTLMCSEEAKERLLRVMESCRLPLYADCDRDAVYKSVLSDKKMKDGRVSAVWVDEPGSCRILELTPEDLRKRIEML